MYKEVLLLILGCIVLIKSAEYAVKAASHLARFMRLTEFVTSFILVAFVSSLPEGFISIISALQKQPSIGLGTLLGGNIADLTLILGLVTLAGHPIRIHSSIVKKDLYFIALIMLPIILGLNGTLSRLDGIILLASGIIFMIVLLKERTHFHKPFENKDHWLKNLAIFTISVALMLLSAHFIVKSTTGIATMLGISQLIIALVLIALGTTLPEFVFSLQSIRKGHSELAIGDLLGTVVVDACIIMGIMAIITPITINLYALSIVGVFTLFAAVFAVLFMRTDSMLTKNEALALILFYIAFVAVQILL